ncbi:hypothetical protein BS47DRAFT_350177 [Hydnum rufescens UP504]|uniref:Uncharacterized protein n=1 Tax=Hydnum rufescens UP504 TaxID=1448309 RepID=A0A9P6AJQ0_9AGAM|nr:hypothetical protein BS47DRAFT_350177 [Hydnum rufescens UP504]
MLVSLKMQDPNKRRQKAPVRSMHMGNPPMALGKRNPTRPIILSFDEDGTNKTCKNEDSNSTFEDLRKHTESHLKNDSRSQRI